LENNHRERKNILNKTKWIVNNQSGGENNEK